MNVALPTWTQGTYIEKMAAEEFRLRRITYLALTAHVLGGSSPNHSS